MTRSTPLDTASPNPLKRREFFKAIGVALGVPLLPTDVCFQDSTGTKLSVRRGRNDIWFVDVARVNIEDMVQGGRPGAIVRCHGAPRECVMVFDRT
jgi:hypothetical protein